jgi:hypothetical protein
MIEKFKDIKGFEELYSISTEGKIWSKYYRKYLKHQINKTNNIRYVRLVCQDGKRRGYSVARLMALTFLENSNPKLYNNAINKNGIFDDLRIENVMWGTSGTHARRRNDRNRSLLVNFISKSPGIVKIARKMTDKLELELIEKYKQGLSLTKLGKIYPIKHSQINNILDNHNINKRNYSGKNISGLLCAGKRKLSDELENNLVQMFKLGYSISQLKDIFSISNVQIYRILKKYNESRSLLSL